MKPRPKWNPWFSGGLDLAVSNGDRWDAVQIIMTRESNMLSATKHHSNHRPDDTLIAELLGRFGLRYRALAAHESLPGSYWGEPEAGLVGDSLYALPDTPLHSILHEACHWICMDQDRRGTLHTDAGGDDAEENAVCYLQILLADAIPGVGRERLCLDMDTWGYSFRLGSARQWFERDAEDARDWLFTHGLIDARHRPTWRVRRRD